MPFDAGNHGLDIPQHFTWWPDRFATEKQDAIIPLRKLGPIMVETSQIEEKKDLPLISGAIFGNLADPKTKSFRTLKNRLANSAAVLDYDGGDPAWIEMAKAGFRQHNCCALIYSTSSWTPENQTWRVVVPVVELHDVEEFQRLVARIDGGILEGTLAAESYNAAHSWFVYGLKGKPPPIVVLIEGGPGDFALDHLAPFENEMLALKRGSKRTEHVDPAERAEDAAVELLPAMQRELLDRMAKRLTTAPDKQKHIRLLRTASHIGRIVRKLGAYPESAIVDLLIDNLRQSPSAMNDEDAGRDTALKGLRHGAAHPLLIQPELERFNLGMPFRGAHIDTEGWAKPSEPPPTRIDLDWWLARPLVPPQPMLGHFVTTGAFLFLGGATGEGKTQLVYAMAGALMTGTDFLHWQCHGARRVLIIDGEMINSLIQQRLRDLHRRLGHPTGAPLHLLARDDFPAMQPLNSEGGRNFVLAKIDELKPDVIIFDSRMCLTLGKLKDEETWAATVPLVMQIKHRKIAQIWIDHMGIVADHIYGDKTKEWTADIVALMLGMSDEDKRQAGADVHFRLKIDKARTRTPDNRADFRDGVITLKDDRWSFTADGDKPAARIPEWCRPYYNALLTVLGDTNNITAGTWQEECERVGYIPSPPEDETPSQRSKRFATFRTVKSKFARDGVINIFGDFVYCSKTSQ
jgi:hypothetical protein